MKRSFWITLFASVATCSVAMTMMNARNETLAKRIAETQPAALRKPNPEAAKATSDVIRDDVSNARVERAIAEITELALRFPLPSISQERPDGSDGSSPSDWLRIEVARSERFPKMIPALLEAVRNLNVEELIATAGQMQDATAGAFLLKLAMDQDPLRVLRDEKLLLDYDPMREMRPATVPAKVAKAEVLAALAKKDPSAALRELPPLETEDLEYSAGSMTTRSAVGLRLQIATQLMSDNPEQGLAILLEVKERGNSLPIGVRSSEFAIVPESIIPQIMSGITDPRYEKISGELIGLAVKSALHHQGIEEMARVLEAMNLSPEKLNEVTNDLLEFSNLTTSQPVATLEWLSASQPGRVPGAFIEWAKQDQTAATNWLNEQPPSPLRDNAIAKFAKEASNLDPEAATAWAQQIQDENLRSETLIQVGKK
jgi:hypothetical protein